MKSIAAAGAILGGSALGVSSVAAGEDEDDDDDHDDEKKKPDIEGDVHLKGVCHDGKQKKDHDDGYATLLGRYRIYNDSDHDLQFVWKEGEGDTTPMITALSKGTITVDADSHADFWVDLNGDHTKHVYLYHGSKKVDWAEVNLDEKCEYPYW